MASQALGLAEAVGFRFLEKELIIRFLWTCLPPRLSLFPFAAACNRGSLSPPWPELVIGCGRNTAMPVLAIRRVNGGYAAAVQIQDPGIGIGAFDLSVAPEHDGLRGAQVVVTRGAVHRVTTSRLRAERRHFSAPAAMERPVLSVLIGCTNRAYRLTLRRMGEIADALGKMRNQGGSALVTPSHRTGAAGVALLRDRLKGLPAVIWDGSRKNPYFAFLALAVAFLVTTDSVSMISEAAATGKPVHILGLGSNVKFARFHAAMQKSGITRPFTGRIESWSYSIPDDTARAAAVRALVLSTIELAASA